MKAKFGMIVVAGSGKIGGHVASKNRSGAYFRTKTTPLNPQTPYQQETRSMLASVSKSWGSLTVEQRASFDAAAKQFGKTNVFGDAYTPTGKNFFTQININRLLMAQTVLTTPPAPVSVPFMSIDEVAEDTGNMVLTLSSSLANTYYVKIRSTKKLVGGVNFIKNMYKLLAVQVGLGTTSQTVDAAVFTARFGETFEGEERYGFNIQIVDKATGIPGTPYSAIIETTSA